MADSKFTKNPPPDLTPASVDKCGSGAILGVSKETNIAVIIPTTCKSWWCPRCKLPKALRLTEKICCGDPERMITLTSNPAAAQTPTESINLMKAGWVRLLRKIRKHFKDFQYVLIWELTKRGWPHIHIACRGPYIPREFLKYWWNEFTSAPMVHITKIKSPLHASRYLAKYFVKDQAPVLRLLNHRRLVQYSRRWALRDTESSGQLEPADYIWFRLPTTRASSVSDMIRCHHLLFNPQGKTNVSWFLLDPERIIPGAACLDYEGISVLHAPPYKCNSPPPSALDGPPLQEKLLF